MNAFANESLKAKSSDSIDQDKMMVLEARIKVIEGVDLYDPIRACEKARLTNPKCMYLK
jgi:hypothetical protein